MRIEKVWCRCIKASQGKNPNCLHKNFCSLIPEIKISKSFIGITDLQFAKWHKAKMKNLLETPFTPEERQLYILRTEKRLIKARDDDLLALHTDKILKEPNFYNFEYILNRGYAVNREYFSIRIFHTE